MSKDRERQRTIELIEKVGLIIVFLDLSLVSILLLHDHAYKLFHYLFSTGGPAHTYHFQWVGVTAAVALVAFIFNQLWERRKLKASLGSQNTIQKLDKIRDLLSEMVVLSTDYINSFLDYNVASFENSDTKIIEQFRVISNEKDSRVLNVAVTLQLYLLDTDGENDVKTNTLLKAVRDVKLSVDNAKQAISDFYLNYNGTGPQNFNVELQTFADQYKKVTEQAEQDMLVIGKIYLDSEFKKASQGK
ncbi:hypothetical protein [Weissella cibaria]|uniref:hypothetical protein n=1 Tax=Weissella cibaria TaxID=137591 RepID=UPI0034E8FA7B